MACPRPATTTIDIEACQARTLLALGRTYNVEISALWSIVDPAGRALTRRAHERWLAYRDDTCRLRARAYEGGTLAPVAFGACAIEITRARIGELRRALEIQCRGHSRTGARKRCPHG